MAGTRFPPAAEAVANRLIAHAERGGYMSPGDLRVVHRLRSGDPTPIAEHLDRLKSQRALTPAHFKEIHELQSAVDELKRHGWGAKLGEIRRDGPPDQFQAVKAAPAPVAGDGLCDEFTDRGLALARVVKRPYQPVPLLRPFG